MSVATRAGSKVLVVEDNKLVYSALFTLLKDEGYDPILFDQGLAAIEYARDQEAPSAALVDIHLPDISGLDVTRQLRQSFGQKIPIFILSGDNSIDTLRTLPRAGATYFFSKPVNVAALITQLRQALG